MAITGECFCGSVKYQVNGKLRDAKSCHCSRCRKAFNSQASASAMVQSEEFEWLSGQDLLTSYIGEHGFGVQFCKICGSTLCGTYKGEIHGITLGCVNGDPKVNLGMHIHVGSKAEWETIPAGVAQFQNGPPEMNEQRTQKNQL